MRKKLHVQAHLCVCVCEAENVFLHTYMYQSSIFVKSMPTACSLTVYVQRCLLDLFSLTKNTIPQVSFHMIRSSGVSLGCFETLP